MNGGFPGLAAVLAAVSLTLTSCGEMTQLAQDNSVDYSNGAVKLHEKEESVSYESDQVFTLDISIKEGEAFPNKYEIADYKALLQNPELPTGCEVTALCGLLNYLGFDIDKVTLADEFLPLDIEGATTMREAYIGDPKLENGFGCYAPVIVQTADDYFESLQSPCYAVDMTGRSLKELCYQVAQGRPVIVWSTIDLIETPANYVWESYEGEEMWFNDFQHCMVIYGYDFEANTVSAADPLAGNMKYDMNRFNETYELMGDQAVLICGNSETKGKFVKREDKPESPRLSRNKAERKAKEEAEARIKAEEEERRRAEEEARRAAEVQPATEPAPDEAPPVPDQAEEPPADAEIAAEEEQE